MANMRGGRHMFGGKSRLGCLWLGSLLFAAAFMIAQPCNGAPGHFANTANLANARSAHTATVLSNGKVLVAGGAGSSGLATIAELFDPTTRTWATTGSLAQGRFFHTATLLTNGRVLVAAGYVGEFQTVGSAELYDPTSGTWTPTGSDIYPGYGRGMHTATLLPNGEVLVAGGFQAVVGASSGTIYSAELYDPVTGIWTETGHLAHARYSHTATLLPDGRVLVAGGSCNCQYSCCGSGPSMSAELYHPESGIWSATGDLRTARSGHTATLLGNGKVLVVGGLGSAGATAELYDPVSGTWSPTGSLALARYDHTAIVLPNGNVLVTGGFGNSNNGLVSAELYNVATGTWTLTGNLVTGRGYQTATLVADGNVVIAGGAASGTYAPVRLASAELYITQPLLFNISTRLSIQSGDYAMIGGVIVTGPESKTIIVRGLGPSLPIPGALADPVIEVYGSAGQLLAVNDNWRDGTYAAQVAATLPPSNDLESALWGSLPPGAYTFVVRGKNDTTGIGLFEAYDLDENANSQLANISTRGLVATGNDVLIGGVIVGSGSGGSNARVLLRAMGPSVPVAGALTDPTLELHDGSGTTIDFNDNWKLRPDGSSQQAEIEGTGIPPTNDREAALLETLSPGNYTAILRGKNGEIGIGLVEAYNLQ
jgi:galactose oxidase-like protein